MRGPALLKLGFHPSADGLDAWMAARQPADDLSSLSDEDYVPLVDAHNRIVALMGGNNPANIVDALATRAAGVGSGAAAAATAEADS